MKDKSNKAKYYEVSADGSLGLLALGYRGLLAWREARKNRIKIASKNGE